MMQKMIERYRLGLANTPTWFPFPSHPR